MQEVPARLQRAVKLTDDVYQFDFEAEFDYEPGQFLMIKVEDGLEPAVKRAYSIASSPLKKNVVTVCAKLHAEGRGSNYLRGLKDGDKVTLEAPYGHFILKDEAEDAEKEILMVATGVGIAPIMSMLETLHEKKSQRKIKLIFGLRHLEDIFYYDVLQGWRQDMPNFEIMLTLSQPPEDWEGQRGRVTDHIKGMKPDSVNTDVYVCGSPEMVKEVRTQFDEKGMPKEAVYFEQF